MWGRSTRVEREKLEDQVLSVSSDKEPGSQGVLGGSRLTVSFVPPELQVSDRLEITALPFVDGCHPVATILEFGRRERDSFDSRRFDRLIGRRRYSVRRRDLEFEYLRILQSRIELERGGMT